MTGRRVDAGTDTIHAEIVDGVGVIRLNRPDRRNALHPEMYDAIPRLIELYEADDEVGCLLVTASGSTFCAGGDVFEGAGSRRGAKPAAGPGAGEAPKADPGAEAAAEGLVHLARMIPMLRESPKISLAALPGPAVGAGVALALACDLRIAAESVRLRGGWAALAFSGDMGGPWLVTRALGPALALEFLTGDEPIDAATAARFGLFNRVVPDEELPGAGLAWARRIAAGPRGAFASMKENVRDAQRLELRDALGRESARMVRSTRTDEHRAAVRRWLADMKANRQRQRQTAEDLTRRTHGHSHQ